MCIRDRFNYPCKSSKVTVPLFIIAKTSKEGTKQIRLCEVIETVSKELQGRYANKNLRILNKLIISIPEFTRVAILDAKLEIENIKNIGKYIKDNNVKSMNVYRDDKTGLIVYEGLLTSILYPLLYDLRSLYDKVINDPELKNAGLLDWLTVLLSLVIPTIRLCDGRTPPNGGDEGLKLASNVRIAILSELYNVLTSMEEWIISQKLRLDETMEELMSNVDNIIKQIRKESTKRMLEEYEKQKRKWMLRV